jgi:sn-glycerol 3-phosphate transport system substrate-binding protein
VFEVGTATMMAAKGAVKPVYEVMKQSGLPFDSNAYLPTVAGYYTTSDGKILSMPFNSSTVILHYNIDAFKKAGLDPAKPPKTWPEVGEYFRKLVASGATPYGLSSSWTGWIHLETLGPWHNVPFGTLENGFGGLGARYTFNTPLYVKHTRQLADWQKDKIFTYGGRPDLGNAKFNNGEMGLYTGSSASYAGFKKTCQFQFGTAMLPYWPDEKGAPQNTIIGGASLWVLNGFKPQEYKGVAAFFDTFDLIHALTRGGPSYATDILVYKAFNDGFINLDLGGSAAQPVILMLVVITLTVIQFRFIERKVHY